MTIPGFSAELGLSEPARSYRSAPRSRAATGEAVVSPEQSLFPPGALVYTCSPPCTWGPPMLQTCCAEICLPLGPWFERCFPTCFTQMAPRCAW